MTNLSSRSLAFAVSAGIQWLPGHMLIGTLVAGSENTP
jgi:hypothetical protein